MLLLLLFSLVFHKSCSGFYSIYGLFHKPHTTHIHLQKTEKICTQTCSKDINHIPKIETMPSPQTYICMFMCIYIKKHIYIFSVCVFRPCSFGVCFTRGALNDNSNNKIMLFGYTQIYLPMYMYVMLNAFEEVIHKLFK